jgi:hypothetical protein
VVECLPSKHEALSSSPTTAKKKKKNICVQNTATPASKYLQAIKEHYKPSEPKKNKTYATVK